MRKAEPAAFWIEAQADFLPDFDRFIDGGDEFKTLTPLKAVHQLLPIVQNYCSCGKAWREHGVTADQVLARLPALIAICGPLGLLAERLVREANDLNPLTPEPASVRSCPDGHLGRCIEAIVEMDGDQLRRQLEKASVDLSRIDLLDNVLVPLMHRVGEGCAGGWLRTASEHLASSVVRTFLDGLHGAYPISDTPPVLVVATPAFQYHELGATLVAAVGRMDGWKTVYLGSNLPAEELAAATKVVGARAIALSIAYPADDPRLVDELLRLRRLLDSDVTILVGGPSSAGYQVALDEVGAIRIDNLAALREYLLAMRSSVETSPSLSIPETLDEIPG